MTWSSDIALDHFVVDAEPEGDAAIVVRRTERLPRRTAYSAQLNRGTIHADGVRIAWDGQMIVDIVDGARLDYVPGPAWPGHMPAAFYSTIAALTLVWRGAVPLHACAVEVGGRGVLIAGPSGAGKSTLAAALVAAGAGFVADDLSVLWPSGDSDVAWISPGRTAMRLHPDTAAWIDCVDARADERDGRGKWLAVPARGGADRDLHIGAVLLLGEEAGAGLAGHLFRPKWMAALPDQELRLSLLSTLAERVPLVAAPVVSIASRSGFERLGQETLERLQSLM